MGDVSNTPSVPYYEDDQVTLYHGHCLDVFSSSSWHTDARIITDPPYGFGAYDTDIAPDLNLLSRWVSDNPTVAIFGYPEHLARLCAKTGATPSEWVTWWPTNPMRGRDGQLQRESEHIAIFGAVPGGKRVQVERSESAKRIADVQAHLGKAKAGDYRAAGDVWTDAKPGSGFTTHRKLHPNEKPVSLMSKLVQLCSEPGEIVLDPFAGSGTTLVAAKSAGRRAIGVEIEEAFCEVIAMRCSQEVLAVA